MGRQTVSLVYLRLRCIGADWRLRRREKGLTNQPSGLLESGKTDHDDSDDEKD